MLRNLANSLLSVALSFTLPAFSVLAADGAPRTVELTPSLQLRSDRSDDQDDMCVWVNPTDPAASVVITADKAAGHVFVYDLSGTMLQSLDVPEPGNIDLRNNVKLDGKDTTVVVCNQREGTLRLRVFRLDPATRQLESIDDGKILTQANYGGCLYHSAASGRLYFVSTTKENGVTQYELLDNGNGTVSGKAVREWPLGKAEGAVADDATGVLYVGEEERGIWKLGAEPDSSTPGELVIRIGDNGLVGDIEGLALATVEDRKLLLLSDQGNNCFLALDRNDGYSLAARIRCQGADSTDGIEVVDTSLGSRFPYGIFCCHTDIGGRPTLISSWESVAKSLAANALPKE